ncbi:MAG: oxidoreductase [Gemmatimonadales bacterium]
MTPDRLTVGLIGFGLGGRVFHAPVIRAVPGLRLTTIAQRKGRPADAPDWDVEFVHTIDELLARKLDLVVITTPNTTHHPVAKHCLLAGRHVVVDKPFTTTVADAEELVALARAQGRLLSVYHNRRYLGDFVTLQQLLAQGALGRIVSFESHFDRFRPAVKPEAWREQPGPGAGVWFDIGPHLLDQALVLFGTPHAIGADLRAERDGAAVDDAFDVTLYYEGLRAVLRGSCLAAAPGPTFVVHGTAGSFIKHGLDPQEAALRAGRTPDEPDWDVEPAELYGTLTTPDGSRRVPTVPSSFTRYYENVRDALLGKEQLAVSPAHALDVMRGVVRAAASSAQRRVLPWAAAD